MTIERAREINHKLLDHGLFRFELENKPLDASIKDISLQDMLTATEMVRSNNPAGAGKHELTCDERLIAAIYTAYHYAAEDPASISPIVQAADGRMVIVVDHRCLRKDEEGR